MGTRAVFSRFSFGRHTATNSESFPKLLVRIVLTFCSAFYDEFQKCIGAQELWIGVRINIIYMLPQAAEPMVLTDISVISFLKAKNNPRLVQGKIHLPVEKYLPWKNVSHRK